jgi:hypothetical protein
MIISNAVLKRVNKMTIAGCLIALVILSSCANLKETEPQHPIPNRSNQADPDMMDLSNYYTASLDDDWLGKEGSNLASLPKGIQAFAQVAFDVRGLIQLKGSTTSKETGLSLPREIKGIQIKYKGSKMHFLHGTSGSAREGQRIGMYVLNYENGQSVNIPILYQRQVTDWMAKQDDPVPTDADIAWSGENAASRKLGCNIRLYRYTVNNPYPDLEIETIDFVSEMTKSAPFLVAVTIEPNQHNYESFRNVRIDNAIIPRSPEAGPDLVDLSEYFNVSTDDDFHNHAGHDLQDLPKGVQELGGVKFDIRGMIVLAGSRSINMTGVVYPEAVNGIKVNRKGKKLHFLQACGWSAEAGAKLGEYVIHYSDGQTKSAPILYQNNIMDWWLRPEDKPPTEAKEVWRGQNSSTRNAGFKTHLIMYTWENPLPDVEITSIDFVSDVIPAAPMLLAITVER